MTRRIINTRVKSRFDSISEWQKDGVELLPGEIALVKIAAGQTDPLTNKILDEPIILMKVGEAEIVTQEDNTVTTRNKSFDELPWLSAKTTDVYDWAKHAEELPVVVITGEQINDDGSKIEIKESKALGTWLAGLKAEATANTADVTSLRDSVWAEINFAGESVDYPDSSTTIKLKDGKNEDGTDKTKIHTVKDGDAVTFEGKLIVYVNYMWSELGGLVYAAGDMAAWRATLNAATPAAEGTSTAFVDTVIQNDGKIRVGRKKIPEASDTIAGIVTLGVPGGAAAFNAVNNLAESVTDISKNYLHINSDNELAIGTDNRNEYKEIIFDCGGPEE